MKNLRIRREEPEDYRAVETLIRDAFWNVNAPGCDEHYLAHVLRDHEDFIPELDLVAELDGQVVGNIMYTRARLTGSNGACREVITFGPLSVSPGRQRQGVGKALLEHSFQRAVELGYDVVVIFGNPDNYVSSGFKSCKRYGVRGENGAFPAAMLVKELCPGALEPQEWIYHESPAYQVDSAQAQAFDMQFPPKEKAYRASQEMFYILSHGTLQ